jgi:hypothetical protein
MSTVKKTTTLAALNGPAGFPAQNDFFNKAVAVFCPRA